MNKWNTAKKPEPRPPKAPPPSEFWMHVRNDLTEERYVTKPEGFRTLHVVLVNDGPRILEQTQTHSLPIRRTFNGPVIGMEAVRPLGVGWKLHHDAGDHCVWRRTRQPAWRYNRPPERAPRPPLEFGD